MDEKLKEKVQELAKVLTDKGMKVAAAESCTGGLISATFTELPGSSNWFDRGFVTYSNAAKNQMLSVPWSILQEHGAVTEICARSMAIGAYKNSEAQIVVSVTGIAGPDSDESGTPVGTVYIGWALKNEEPDVRQYSFNGTREEIRKYALDEAVNGLLRILK